MNKVPPTAYLQYLQLTRDLELRMIYNINLRFVAVFWGGSSFCSKVSKIALKDLPFTNKKKLLSVIGQEDKGIQTNMNILIIMNMFNDTSTYLT